MKHVLIKRSRPGWEKAFDTDEEANHALYNCICRECVNAYDLRMNCTINDLLATDCGCEYDYEVEE